MESRERLTGGLWRFWITRLLRPRPVGPQNPQAALAATMVAESLSRIMLNWS